MPNRIRPENAHRAHRGRSSVRHALTTILLICSIGAIRVMAASGSGAYFAQATAGAVHSTASSLAVTFPSSTVAGDVILVGFDYATTASASSVTDSQGNAFTQVGSPVTTPGGATSAIYYATNIKSGSDTVTVHLSASSAFIEVYQAEYHGVNTASPIDAHVGATGAAGTVSSGNATTTVAGDIIFGYCVGDSACTAGAGFASRSTLDGNLTEDMTAGNPGAYAATGVANSSWSMKMVALKPAGATITSPTTANGTVGGSFSYQITASNSPTSYSATGLPAGLSLNTTTGLISGTPTAAGTYSVTLSATGSTGTASGTLTLTITPASYFAQTTASAVHGSASSLSVSFPNKTVAGDLILVAFDYPSNATVSSVGDTQGNAFAEVGSQLTSPGGTRSVVYYATKITGGPDTVTVKLTANCTVIEVYLSEYYGLNSASPIDTEAGATGSSSAVSSGNATTTVTGDIIYGYCVGDWACTEDRGFLPDRRPRQPRRRQDYRRSGSLCRHRVRYQ